MCGLSLYLLNDISEDIFGRINVKMDKLNKDISLRDEEIYRLYSILTEVEKLYLEGKPDASNIFEDTTNKFARLEEIVEKIKNVRENRTLTIDIELTKKVN
jgi:archaellum component FlaC